MSRPIRKIRATILSVSAAATASRETERMTCHAGTAELGAASRSIMAVLAVGGNIESQNDTGASGRPRMVVNMMKGAKFANVNQTANC